MFCSSIFRFQIKTHAYEFINWSHINALFIEQDMDSDDDGNKAIQWGVTGERKP